MILLCVIPGADISKRNQRQILILVQANTPTCTQPKFGKWEHIVMFDFTRWCILAKKMVFCCCFLILIYFARRWCLFTPKKINSNLYRKYLSSFWLSGENVDTMFNKNNKKNQLYWFNQSIHSARYIKWLGICDRVHIIWCYLWH